jgi:hypothetical protein
MIEDIVRFYETYRALINVLATDDDYPVILGRAAEQHVDRQHLMNCRGRIFALTLCYSAH